MGAEGTPLQPQLLRISLAVPSASLLRPGDTGQQAEGVCSCSHSTGHLQTAHAQRQGTRQASSGRRPPAPLWRPAIMEGSLALIQVMTATVRVGAS